MINEHIIVVVKLLGNDYFVDPGINGRVILKYVLEKSSMKLRTEFYCCRIGVIGWPS
jgi:hypothetical protein